MQIENRNLPNFNQGLYCADRNIESIDGLDREAAILFEWLFYLLHTAKGGVDFNGQRAFLGTKADIFKTSRRFDTDYQVNKALSQLRAVGLIEDEDHDLTFKGKYYWININRLIDLLDDMAIIRYLSALGYITPITEFEEKRNQYNANNPAVKDLFSKVEKNEPASSIVEDEKPKSYPDDSGIPVWGAVENQTPPSRKSTEGQSKIAHIIQQDSNKLFNNKSFKDTDSPIGDQGLAPAAQGVNPIPLTEKTWDKKPSTWFNALTRIMYPYQKFNEDNRGYILNSYQTLKEKHNITLGIDYVERYTLWEICFAFRSETDIAGGVYFPNASNIKNRIIQFSAWYQQPDNKALIADFIRKYDHKWRMILWIQKDPAKLRRAADSMLNGSSITELDYEDMMQS